MINKRLKAYRTYQRFLRSLLTITGCWHMPTKFGKSMYYWSVCVLLLMIIYSMLSLRMIYIARHNMRIMMKYVNFVISGLSTVLKMLSFKMNRNTLINYHRTLNDLFEEELIQNEKAQTIIFSSLRAISTLAYIYFVFLTGILVAYSKSSYIYVIQNLLYFHLPTNYTLPLSRGFGWFWTIPDNFLYHIHMLYETGLIALSCMMACGVDSAFGFYVYQISSTIRAMMFALTNPLSTEKFSDLLRTCAVKHQKLLQCRNTLEHLYGPIIFWHIVSNAVLLCFLIYDFTSLSVINFETVSSSVSYAGVKLLQTFMYTWYGTFLTNAGEEFRKAIYFSRWLNSNLDCHVRTNIILMLMQKPMTINAVFSPVNVTMFTNVSIYYNTIQ
ncbi:Putative odorant receptor 49a [Trachymyrmex septentrionalis]|uniref:Odorant receptor n=1 Tax=Trachymyrmex septentrionalis TaxID=34720 RepID=A0A195F5Y2_9HYME|nr:Putative odorant receptor 49a [Trachymyrmex septentrionalis]